MRPLGFESPTERFERSLVVGLAAGAVAAVLVSALVFFAKSATAIHSSFAVAAAAFGLIFFAGFTLAFMWPDYAPPQPKDDGDEESGVPARLIPPLPVLDVKAFPDSNDQTA
jgi:hypothetical protein